MTQTTESPNVRIDARELRRRRKLQGDTQTSLAAKCEIADSYVSLIETGTRKTIGPAVFAKLCDALGIDKAHRAELMLTEEAA